MNETCVVLLFVGGNPLTEPGGVCVYFHIQPEHAHRRVLPIHVQWAADDPDASRCDSRAVPASLGIPPWDLNGEVRVLRFSLLLVIRNRAPYHDFRREASPDSFLCRCFRQDFDNNTNAANYAVAMIFSNVHLSENNIFWHDGDPPVTGFSCDASDARAATAAGTVECFLDDHDQSLAVEDAFALDFNGDPLRLPDGGVSDPRLRGTLDLAIRIKNDTSIPNTFQFGPVARIDNVTEIPIQIPGPQMVTTLDGNVSLLISFGSDVGHTSRARWVIRVGNETETQIIETPGIREFSLCSNNGICDLSTGSCDCLGDSSGSACDHIPSAELFGSRDPFLNVFVEDPQYEGDVLVLETLRSESDDFNFIQTIANNNKLFRVSGSGHVRFHDCFQRHSRESLLRRH